MSKKTISKMLFSNQERVELGIVQDAVQEYKKGLDLYTSAISTMDRASEILDNAEKLYSKVEAVSKEMGFPVPSDTAKMGQRIKELAKEARSKKR